MRSEAELHALDLVHGQRPWWKPTYVMVAALLLLFGELYQGVALGWKQHELAAAIARVDDLSVQNHALILTAAASAKKSDETSYHDCAVTRALIKWAAKLGPLERTVRSDSAYHLERLEAFAELSDTIERVDRRPCVPPGSPPSSATSTPVPRRTPALGRRTLR